MSNSHFLSQNGYFGSRGPFSTPKYETRRASAQDSGLRLPRSLDQGCQIPVPGPLFPNLSKKLEAQLSPLLSLVPPPPLSSMLRSCHVPHLT